MDARQNLLRAIAFERPDYIPVRFVISGACWEHYPRDAIEELMATHRLLFPDFDRVETKIELEHPPWQRKDKPYTDSWGCRWETSCNGLTGAVTKHPLASWNDFDDYQSPDAGKHNGWGPVDWAQVAVDLQKAQTQGKPAEGSLRHGHTFLTLSYIRGYQNVIFDMLDENPRLFDLIDMVESFNLQIVRQYVELGVEWMGYPEDLGMQVGPMLSLEHFRKYIRPTYSRLMAPARDAGCIVHMHSDGDIRQLAADLVDLGVHVINLQDLVNGIDWIKEHLKGKTCIDLDIDRQKITRFGTPAEIEALVREEVEELGSSQGGLMMCYGLYPGVPLENVKAIMDAMEKYATYYS